MNPTNQRELLLKMSSNATSEQPYPEVISTPSEGYRDIHGTYSGYPVTSAAAPVATQDGSSVIIQPCSVCAE
jgi:hypothetical protein